ncbi:MAG: TetR/AcrR family transcriptional regulator [Myxococcota bacterium]
MSTDSPDPLLEERARRIIETTIELAEKGGFEAVRLRDVAAHAGVAMGTLYRRFRSKEDLLVAALESETRALEERVNERSLEGASARDRVLAYFEMQTRGMLRRPNLSRAMLRATAAGEPALARKVGLFHEMMGRMTVAALRGSPTSAAQGESQAKVAPELTDREKLVADVLNQVWFAVMLGWAGGLETQATINERMRAASDLILDAAERDS